MSSTKAGPTSSSSAASGGHNAKQARVDQPSDLLVSVKYHNSLPYPPCGLFMKPVAHRDMSEYAECTPSTLEKNLFVWAPHMPHDIGLDVDLVDQAKLSCIEYPDRLTLLDDKILSHSSAKNDKKDSALNAVVDQSWFLRSHKQFSNNLFRRGNKNVANNSNSSNNNKIANDFTPYNVKFIEDSFLQVDQMQKLLENSRKGDAIEAVYDIFPDISDNPSYLAKFDEEPFPDARLGKNIAGLKRMVDSLLYNIRSHKDTEKDAAMEKFISLVAARDDNGDEEAKVEKDMDDLFGADDDSDAGKEKEDNDSAPRNKKTKFAWVQDYVMSMKPLAGTDETVVLKMHRSTSTDEVARYQTILSRIDLSSIPLGEEIPINVTVKRK